MGCQAGLCSAWEIAIDPMNDVNAGGFHLDFLFDLHAAVGADGNPRIKGRDVFSWRDLSLCNVSLCNLGLCQQRRGNHQGGQERE